MAHIANRSRFRVTVKNKPDLTLYFSFNKVAEVETYMRDLRAQGYTFVTIGELLQHQQVKESSLFHQVLVLIDPNIHQ